MVDNRAAGFYGVSGALNFKSGDISGTTAKTNEDKANTDAEYMRIEKEEPQTKDSAKYTDRSAQLNAALKSLALLNISSVISSKLPKIKQTTKRFKEMIDETEELLVTLNEERSKDNDNHEQSSSKQEHDEDEEEYY